MIVAIWEDAVGMKEKNRQIIVSGYGSKEKNEIGIAEVTLTAGMEQVLTVLEQEAEFPSFLCNYDNMCFAVEESIDCGVLLCFERLNDTFVLRDRLELDGGLLCHLAYNHFEQTLYGAFYETGHVVAVKVEDFLFKELLNCFVLDKVKYDGVSRAHCCLIEPESKRVLITNIATDRIYIFNTVNGKLEDQKLAYYVQLDEGIGPRHLKFHRNLKFLYLITEYSNEVLLFYYNVKSNILELKQRASILPDGYHNESYGSSLDISRDGRYLYAANRGANTIAVFSIDDKGFINRIQDADCNGNWPRHIALTRDDRALMIANQLSNQIVIQNVDRRTGKLIDVGNVVVPFFEPSFVEEL